MPVVFFAEPRVKWNINRSADPEFPVGIAAVENRARFESVADMMTGGSITEARLDGIVDFASISWINQAGGIVGIERDTATRNGLQMPVACIKFPVPDLLKQAQGGNVLIVAGSAIPTI